MFDIGFSELIVIGVVALIVLGPERLPKVARTIGLWAGKAQRYINDVKADINREMQLEELRKLQEEVRDSTRKLEDSVKAQMSAVETEIDQAKAAVAELENTLRHSHAEVEEHQPDVEHSNEQQLSLFADDVAMASLSSTPQQSPSA